MMNRWGLDGFDPGGELTGVKVSDGLPDGLRGDYLGDCLGDCLNLLMVRVRSEHMDLCGSCWMVFISLLFVNYYSDAGPFIKNPEY